MMKICSVSCLCMSTWSQPLPAMHQQEQSPRLTEMVALKVYAGSKNVGDGPCPPGCWGTASWDCHCPWSIALQNMREQTLPVLEKTALKVTLDNTSVWRRALEKMHEQPPHLTEMAALKVNGAVLAEMHENQPHLTETAALKVTLARQNGVGPYGGALEDMHESQPHLTETAALKVTLARQNGVGPYGGALEKMHENQPHLTETAALKVTLAR